MFKPMNFRLKNTIYWPGIGPANEIAASNILKVEDEGEDYLFVHASGSAVKVPKAQVTVYGVYDADTVPNLPTSDQYKDGTNADSDSDDTGTRSGGNSTPLPTEPKGPEPVGEDSPDAGELDGQSDKSDPVDAPIDASIEDADKPADTTVDAPIDEDKSQPAEEGTDAPVDTSADSDNAVEAPTPDTPQADSADKFDGVIDTGTNTEPQSEAPILDADNSGSTGDVVQPDTTELADSKPVGSDDNSTLQDPIDAPIDETCDDTNCAGKYDGSDEFVSDTDDTSDASDDTNVDVDSDSTGFDALEPKAAYPVGKKTKKKKK